jgi:hypothetical protein
MEGSLTEPIQIPMRLRIKVWTNLALGMIGMLNTDIIGTR